MDSAKDASTAVNALSSWPIEKYSYFVSPLSQATENDWLHFPHRNNLYFVIDRRTASVNGTPYVQTWLKIVWNIQLLVCTCISHITKASVHIQLVGRA
jgi:hypothetical protein